MSWHAKHCNRWGQADSRSAGLRSSMHLKIGSKGECICYVPKVPWLVARESTTYRVGRHCKAQVDSVQGCCWQRGQQGFAAGWDACASGTYSSLAAPGTVLIMPLKSYPCVDVQRYS
jgi:hypothetical protein